MPRATLPPLTDEQVDALLDFITDAGRGWRAALNAAWMNASAPAPLQRLRNTHGPTWLARFDLGRVERSDAGSARRP